MAKKTVKKVAKKAAKKTTKKTLKKQSGLGAIPVPPRSTAKKVVKKAAKKTAKKKQPVMNYYNAREVNIFSCIFYFVKWAWGFNDSHKKTPYHFFSKVFF